MSVSRTVPATETVEITPDDDATFAPPFRSLWVGSAGSVKITDAKGNDTTFVLDGAGPLPVEVQRVFATGTDATGIVGLR